MPRLSYDTQPNGAAHDSITDRQLCEHTLNAARPVALHNILPTSDPAPRAFIAAPVTVDGRRKATVSFSAHVPRQDFGTDDRALIATLANVAGRILETPHLDPSTLTSVRLDPLTGATTRVQFNDDLHNAFRRCRAERQTAALILLDLDGFGGVNHNLGHLVADHVLRKIGLTLRSLLLNGQRLYRVGGDSFALIAADISLGRARTLADILRDTVANTTYEDEASQLRLTASAGLAAISLESQSEISWMKEAQQALYQAKLYGGDQTLSAFSTARNLPRPLRFDQAV